jgi:hypothetical protein
MAESHYFVIQPCVHIISKHEYLISSCLSGIGQPGNGVILPRAINSPDTIELFIWCDAGIKHRVGRVGNIPYTLHIRSSITTKSRNVTTRECDRGKVCQIGWYAIHTRTFDNAFSA